MQTTPPLQHLTLNTGHIAHTSGLTPPEELASVQPLLKSGGPIPAHYPFWVELNRQGGWASFYIYRCEVPITLNVLAWDDAAALSAWSWIEHIYLKLSDQFADAMAAVACPAPPTTTPWLATILLPTLALSGQTANELLWIEAFERIYAEALLPGPGAAVLQEAPPNCSRSEPTNEPMDPTQSAKLHSSVGDENITVDIYSVATKFHVRYRDGKLQRSRAFYRLERAQEFARLVARRQHWAQIAVELGARQRTPVAIKFVIALTTATSLAVDVFLSARGEVNDSPDTLDTTRKVLLSSLRDAPTLGALSVDWARQALAAPNLSKRKRELRHAALGNFLGWLARQPIEEHLSVAQSEAVLRARPDQETQRFVALCFFAGLLPR